MNERAPDWSYQGPARRSGFLPYAMVEQSTSATATRLVATTGVPAPCTLLSILRGPWGGMHLAEALAAPYRSPAGRRRAQRNTLAVSRARDPHMAGKVLQTLSAEIVSAGERCIECREHRLTVVVARLASARECGTKRGPLLIRKRRDLQPQPAW